MLSIVLALVGCGWFGDGGDAPEAVATVDDNCLSLPIGEPEVVVTYATSVDDADPVSWIHWRGPTQVGRYYPARGEAEVWVNHEDTISMERWYVADKRVYLQMPQDLAAHDVRIDWHSAGSLVEPGIRERYEAVPASAFRCMQAVTHAGQVGMQHHNITWLPQLGLPGRYAVRGAGPTRITTLEAIGAPPELVALREARASFEVITTEQLRDMGDDPFAIKVRRPAQAVRAQK